MFVVIYTPGPAWLQGKPVREQPFYREHGRYMQQVFADKRLLMGGAFLDNQGGLGILDVANEAQARVFEPHLHPWHAYFNQYKARSAQSGS